MINAIQLLKMEAQARRSMTTPNAHTITEYAAAENAKLADEYEFAAEALRKLHNEGFNEGVLAGLKALAESCKARRERKAPNAELRGRRRLRLITIDLIARPSASGTLSHVV